MTDVVILAGIWVLAGLGVGCIAWLEYDYRRQLRRIQRALHT